MVDPNHAFFGGAEKKRSSRRGTHVVFCSSHQGFFPRSKQFEPQPIFFQAVVVPAAVLTGMILQHVYGSTNKNRAVKTLVHKVNLSTRVAIVKVLAKRGAVMPIRKDRAQHIPNLYKMLTMNSYDTRKLAPANEENQEVEEEEIMEQHYACNMANLVMALVFLHARLVRLAARETDFDENHMFGIVHQQVRQSTQKRGEWAEEDMHELNKVSEQSLYQTFQPFFFFANKEQQELIKTLFNTWKKSKEKGKRKEAQYESYFKAVKSCMINLETVCEKLFDADPDPEHNIVVKVLSELDGHFEKFTVHHVNVGVVSLSQYGHSSFARMLLNQEKLDEFIGLPLKEVAQADGGDVDGGDGDDDDDDGDKKPRAKKKKGHLLSYTKQDKTLYRNVVDKAEKETLEEIEQAQDLDDDEKDPHDWERLAWQRDGFLALALADGERMVRNVTRAAALREAMEQYPNAPGHDPNRDKRNLPRMNVTTDAAKAFRLAEKANDDAILDGSGAFRDMAMHLLSFAYQSGKVAFRDWNVCAGQEAGYESLALLNRLPGNKKWKDQKKRAVFDRDGKLMRSFRELVLQKRPIAAEEPGGAGEDEEEEEMDEEHDGDGDAGGSDDVGDAE